MYTIIMRPTFSLESDVVSEDVVEIEKDNVFDGGDIVYFESEDELEALMMWVVASLDKQVDWWSLTSDTDPNYVFGGYQSLSPRVEMMIMGLESNREL